ncbi:Protein of unknown function [Flavobacterium swingsii]|jgi:hypothetical protein|uniref:DUF4199 domain-containing protein n=1 Tax=Flavobacterium swingsii TaxID=498292 RepID=A0A1I0ZEQ8_9FLAO|nr:DUF4199 family protein [Flavobacterium swingsii]SFB22693.1 Protein of unknown function [Flavobacterium swingsii]
MNPIIKKNGFILGIILGIINILITCYLYFSTNLHTFTDLRIGMFKIIIGVILGIITIVMVKMKTGGLITFREAFSAYFTTILTSSIMSFIFFFLFFSSFATDLKKESIKKDMIEFQVKTMKQNGSTDLEIENVKKSYETFNPFSFIEGFSSSIKYLLRDSIIGLLVALIFRNKISHLE